mmetsp:Transcript_32201/g.99252  ORF Transcript_32201/g.99252 Transcript_32201/m.99252 type:complete len:520 (-) Transcript_32201:59-1618(-)
MEDDEHGSAAPDDASMADRDAPVKEEEEEEPAVKAEGGSNGDGAEAEDKPEMKKQSGYLYFCAQHRGEVAEELAKEGLDKAEANKQIMKRLGVRWSGTSADDKKKYVEDAPMVAVKPKKPRKRKADKDGETSSKSINVAELRKAKSMFDEGILSEGEFIAKKAIILGLTAKQVAEGVKAGEAARAMSGGSSPPPPPASPKKKKSGGKADKEPRMELPTKALDPFMKELCECQQDNPKRKGSKSAETYDLYKCAQTFEEMLEKGAKKADVANDVAKGFCKLQDAEQQERIMGMRKPVAPKAKKEKSEASEPAEDAPPDDEPADEKPAKKAKKEKSAPKIDARYVAIRGRYFVRRVANDPEDGLDAGYEGPTKYANATGALVLSAEPPPSGAIRMRGIADPGTGQLFSPTLKPNNQTAKPSDDGVFKFKLSHASVDGLEMATGKVTLKIAEQKDSRGQPILVGKYEFHAKRPEEDLDSLWEEQIRCTRAPPATDDWPEHLFPDHPTTDEDIAGTMEDAMEE